MFPNCATSEDLLKAIKDEKVQMIDLRFYNSRWAQRRRTAIGIPDSLHGWLFGQMLTWFGILYYGLTEDLRWYVAGLVIQLLSFLAFPIRKDAA